MSIIKKIIELVNPGLCTLCPESEAIDSLACKEKRWAVIIIANYNCCSKAVDYVLNNFTTIDLLSYQVNIYMPGYIQEDDLPITDLLSGGESNREFLGTCERKDDNERFFQKTLIRNKRLGSIYFNEEIFANFVADLVRKTENKYEFWGGCDLVLIPINESRFLYNRMEYFHLDSIIENDTEVSLDQFLYRTLIFLREANSISFASMQGYKENSKSLSEIYEVFKKSMSSYSDVVQQVDCLPNFLNSLKIEGEELLLKYNKRFYRVFKKRDLINRALYINASMCENQDYLTYLVCIAKIKNLYKEAIKNVYLPPKEEIINRIVIDIEKHLQWKLSEKFFFISYSTKDTLKAETLRSKIQRFGFLVWIAPDGIPQGMDYSLVIPTTLKMTKNFILLLTENSATSKWVMREIDTAINNEQTKLRILLTNGFGVKKISEYNDLEFYLNKVQISYNYEDIIEDDDKFRMFIS